MFCFSGNAAMFVYLLTTYNEIDDWLENYYADSHWLVLFVNQPARKKFKVRSLKENWHHRSEQNILNLFIV